jgi:alkanesulfonate monooxygenase SsuD/methylene tetrahydromethanopterin reductase-like flavin-dependent oxidoreductase (luciferase family)
VEFGAHLPLMDFGGHPYTLEHLVDYTKTAARSGFTVLGANDHLVFAVPWLDGPTALAATMEHSGRMTLATTVTLAVVRGPVAVAKALGGIDRLSGGRMLAVVGPGSSPADYASVALDFEQRWARVGEAVQALRALWRPGSEPFVGRFYSTEGMRLEPAPAQAGGPPLWLGSWGSDAGLRRVARVADGWLASAYNTTPELFADARARLGEHLRARGRESDEFPNGLATMWFFITEDRTEADRIFRERLVPAIHRPAEELRERLPVGGASAFAEKLAAFADAGVQRVLLWPVAHERRQLELFSEKVRPLV